MANNLQPKLKAATERFFMENFDFRYCKDDKTWYRYNGTAFEIASDEFESRTAQIWEESELLYDVHLKTLRKLCSLKMTIDEPLNRDSAILLNTPDGVINFQKFCELHQAGINHKEHLEEWIRPHCEYKNNYLTNITGASYKRDSLPPKQFLKFIEDLFQGDLELVDYFLRLLSCSLTGITIQQFFHILYGIGRNGKSTLLTIIESIFGSYCSTISNSVIELRGDNDKAFRTLYKNRFKRLIVFNELDQNIKLNLPLLKLISGADPIPVQTNRQEKKFIGQFNILLNTNFIPAVVSIENVGIWERLRVIITRPPIPGNQRIDDFYKSIIKEKDQILTHLIDNYLVDVLKSGLKDIPKVMRLMKSFKKFSEDPVEFFFDHTIKLANHPVNNEQWVKARFLYGQYCQFHLLISKAFEKMLRIRDENPSRKVLVPPVSEVKFSRRMKEFGAFEKKDSSEFYTNIYFSEERVYSELGKRVESAEWEKSKQDFIDWFEGVYINKRRIDETFTPIEQAINMTQMPQEVEQHFEEPSPPSRELVINIDPTAYALGMMFQPFKGSEDPPKQIIPPKK